MANEGDRIEVQFTQTEALAQRLLDAIEKDIALAASIGDQLEVARLEAKKQAIGGPQQYARETPQIQQDTAALEAENAVRKQGLDTELRTLDVLKQQAAARAEAFMAGGATGMRGADPQAEAAAARSEQMLARQASIAKASEIAYAAAAGGSPLGPQQRGALISGPQGAAAASIGGPYTQAEQQLVRYNTALKEYEGNAENVALHSSALSANFTRLGVTEAEASSQMRAHGALTTEWLAALARGETTISEFGYQVGATIGKFAGWTAAAGATYAVLGGLVELGKGAIDGSNAVGMLKRTIDGLDTQRAAEQIRGLSEGTATSMKEAGDAVFQFSRTFHNQNDAVAAAKNGLAAYQLDQVKLADSVRMSTAIHQQFGLSAQQLTSVYDMLAAGQREWNARISDMVPLLQRSTGAVKNAGGDLNQLIQLGAYATRTTQYSGSQIGTAFYRSAATFLSPATTKGQTDRQTLEGLGINVNQGWTEIMQQALQKAPKLSDTDRQKMALAIFGPQFGGRLSAIFNPQSVPTYMEMTGRGGDPSKALTPGATAGSLQQELNRQIDTTRKQLDQFIYGLQRFGSALASAGAFAPLHTMLRDANAAVEALTAVSNAFTHLGAGAREFGTIAIEVAAVMLASRTRFGTSIADATGLSVIPGFGASAAGRARQEMTVGVRQGLQRVGQSIEQTAAQMTAIGEKQMVLERERAALQGQIKDAGRATTTQLEERNAIDQQILALSREQNVLAGQLTGQQALSAERQATLTGLQTRARKGGLSNAEVLAMQAKMNEGTAGIQEATSGAESTIGRFAAFRAGAMQFVTGVGGLTAAFFLFPTVMDVVSKALDNVNNAVKGAKDAAQEPVDTLQALQQKAADLRATAKKLDQNTTKSTLPGALGSAENWLLNAVGGPTGLQPAGGAAPAARQRALQLQDVAGIYRENANMLSQDAPELLKTQAGREKLYQLSQSLKQSMGRSLRASGLDSKDIGQIYQAFIDDLQNRYNQAVAKYAPAAGPSLYQVDLAMDPKKLTQQLQAYEDAQKVFGNNNDTMQRALTGYAALVTEAARPGNQNNDQLLQEVAQAQGNYVNAVTKNVQDMMRKSSLETNTTAQIGDLSSALGQIHNAENQIRAMMQRFQNSPKILEALNQLVGLVADQGRQIQQQILQVMKSRTDLAVSSIQGVSPEADIQRAQASVNALKQEVAYAKANGFDAQTVNDLMTQLNNAEQTLLKQQIDNARKIVEAQGRLAEASITGLSPADDIARAQAALSTATTLLGFDQAHGAGQAAILQDQAAVFDAQRTLNQQIQQRDQQLRQDLAAFIQAQAAYQESLTTDPITQARDALAADIKVLGTIQPQDYKTYQEYQTAVLDQKAKVNKDRQDITKQIVDTDMRTLQFELHTTRITDQQYVNGLQQLLKMKQLTLEERQNILTQIYDATHQAAVNLNVDSIKLPTTYEVRRAIRGAMLGAIRGSQQEAATATVQSTTNNNVSVNVTVTKDGDLGKVAKVLDEALKTNIQGQAQAMGVI